MQNGSGNFTPFANLCEKETEGEMIGHAVFLGVVMAFTLFGNFMVIGTVATYEKLRTVTNYFVISLAVSDVLVGFTTLPLKVRFAFIAMGPVLIHSKKHPRLQFVNSTRLLQLASLH